MSNSDIDNLGDLSMLELFRMETETQSTVLTEGLLGLERDADAPFFLAKYHQNRIERRYLTSLNEGRGQATASSL